MIVIGSIPVEPALGNRRLPGPAPVKIVLAFLIEARKTTRQNSRRGLGTPLFFSVCDLILEGPAAFPLIGASQALPPLILVAGGRATCSDGHKLKYLQRAGRHVDAGLPLLLHKYGWLYS